MTNGQIALVFVFFAFGCLVLLKDCAYLYFHSHKPPQKMTVEELYRKGPGENLFIEVTNVRFTGRYKKLYSSGKDGKPTNHRYGACLEAVPLNNAEGINVDDRVLFRTMQPDDRDIDALTNRTSVVGMYCNNLFDIREEQKFFESGDKAEKLPVLDDHIEVPGTFYFFALAGAELIFAAFSFVFVRKGIRDFREMRVAESENLSQHLPAVKAERLSSSSGDFQKDLNKAKTLLEMKRRDDAIQELYCMMQWYPDQAIPQAFLAQILPDEYYAGALRVCRRAIASSPDTAYCHLVHAQLLRRRERWKEAQSAIEESLRIDPKYKDALVEACVICVEQQSYDKASSYVDSGLETNPEDFALLNNKALVLWQMKKRDEAARFLNLALAVEPNNTLAHYNIGLLLKQQKQVDRALHHFKIAFQLEPGNRSYRREISMLSRLSPIKRISMFLLTGAACLLGAPLVIAFFLSNMKFARPIKKLILAVGFFIPAIAIQTAALGGNAPYLAVFWHSLRSYLPAYASIIWGLAIILLPWVPPFLLMLLEGKIEESIVKREMAHSA
jgi:tetratricopeptide (TPR) repeat protein